jgi:hypothetical protein
VPTLQLKGDRFPYPDMLMEAVTEKLAQSDRPNGTDKADHMLISVSDDANTQVVGRESPKVG